MGRYLCAPTAAICGEFDAGATGSAMAWKSGLYRGRFVDVHSRYLVRALSKVIAVASCLDEPITMN